MAKEGTAAWYRERADRLRELARQSRDPETRLEQLKTAQQFELLARRAEAKGKKSEASDQ